MEGRPGRFVVECSVALADPYLARALRRLTQVVSNEKWIEGLVVRALPGVGPPLEVKVGRPPDGYGVSQGKVIVVQDSVNATSVSIIASLSDEGGCEGRPGAHEMLQDLSKIVAGRIAAQETVGSIGESGLSEIMGTLSHDLRTPLACVKGYLSLLDEGHYAPGSPEWAEFFALVVSECDRLVKLVATLLETSADEPRIKVSGEPVLVPALVNHILLEERFVSRGHRFAVDVQPNARVAWADPTRLEQVLRNLVDNAVKYSPDGSLVMIRVRRSGDELLFSVADQGNGIAPEHLNRLFERFYRVRDKHSRSVSGTGLGLPIARQIVEAHGGEIWAESTPGKGSAFCFTLPCMDVEGPKEETV